MANTAVTAPAFTVLDLPVGEPNLIGLARVPTDGQDARLQHDALTDARCGRIYTEKVSTRKAASERQGPAAAFDAGAARQADANVMAVNIWVALHGIVSLRTSRPNHPWPPVDTLVEAALSGQAGLDG